MIINCQNFYKENPEQSPNWKNGSTNKKILLRLRSVYRNWRLKVFKRDNYTCKKCQNGSNKLEAHHLKPLSIIMKELSICDLNSIEMLEIFNSVNNGDTLCKICHREFHKLYGKNKYTIEQYIKWLNNSEKINYF